MSNSILIAEDNLADVLLVRRALTDQQIDCEILVAGDGEEAIALIDKFETGFQHPSLDLLLLDLHLPKHDGADVLRHLRAGERCGQTPVIILTSSDSPEDQDNAERFAPVYYFRKPPTLRAFMTLGPIVKALMEHERVKKPVAERSLAEGDLRSKTAS